MATVIDTSVLIELERRRLPLSSIASSSTGDAAISAVTMAELLFGLHRARTEQQRRTRQQFIEEAFQLSILPYDERSAEAHARIWAELAAVGQPIGAHDFLIAATALAHECELLTLNVREFSRVSGLPVRGPNW